MQSAPFGPDRFDRWTSTGTPPPRVLAAHEGELYAVLRKSGPASADGGALVRHGAFGPRMDEAWARLGDGDGIEAMASLDGALYVLARGALATLDLATLARTPAGDAPGATALASWRGALYAVAHDELLRCERGDPARPKACTRWVHAGDARGVMALASHEGRLYAAAGEQILARDDGGAWAVAGRVAGIGDIVAMASSNP